MPGVRRPANPAGGDLRSVLIESDYNRYTGLLSARFNATTGKRRA
jgi:hypothetical protein